jgi:spermidine/putrescine transport system ATP-binding protein
VLECGNGSAVCSVLSTRLGAAVDSNCKPGPAAIVIRPERITLNDRDEPVPAGSNAVNGTVAQVVYHGASTQVHVDIGETTALIVDVPNQFGPHSVGYESGMAVTCVCSQDAVRVLTRSTAALTTDPAAELVTGTVEALSVS